MKITFLRSFLEKVINSENRVLEQSSSRGEPSGEPIIRSAIDFHDRSTTYGGKF